MAKTRIALITITAALVLLLGSSLIRQEHAPVSAKTSMLKPVLFAPIVLGGEVPPATVSLRETARCSRIGYPIVALFGEVVNNTSQSVAFVRANYTFFLGDDIAGEKTIYAAVPYLLPGQRAIYSGFAFPQPGWTRYDLALAWDEAGPSAAKNTPLLFMPEPFFYFDEDLLRNPWDTETHGRVTNTTGQSIHDVIAMVIYRRADGSMLATDYDLAYPTTVVPNTFTEAFFYSTTCATEPTRAEGYAIGRFY